MTQVPGRSRIQTAPDDALHPPDERLLLDVHTDAIDPSALARDVERGLSSRPYALPPRWFYDEVGAKLFDQICYTPEYYLTRCEAALLTQVAPAVVARAKPDYLIELGSGAARKTRLLLDALVRSSPQPVYVPLDLSEAMLRKSALALLGRYPTLRVHAIVGDYERHVEAAPRDGRRLVAFLGSTLGNLDEAECEAFLASLRRQLVEGDCLLLGVDLVKDPAVIERAYNDAAGITAAFNRNVLAVINRQLGGDFRPELFDHVAYFDAKASRIEMHLRVREDHTARVRALGLEVPFVRGETIHTEISRKFTREAIEAALAAAGFVPERWDDDGMFGLVLARVG